MNFDDLTTSELRAYIRRNDDLQEEAVLELCTRHDCGDVVEFLESLKFRPADVNTFIREAEKRKLPRALTAAATGLTPNAVKKRSYRMSKEGPFGPQPDKTSKPAFPRNVVELSPAEQRRTEVCGVNLNKIIQDLEDLTLHIIKYELSDNQQKRLIKIAKILEGVRRVSQRNEN